MLSVGLVLSCHTGCYNWIYLDFRISVKSYFDEISEAYIEVWMDYNVNKWEVTEADRDWHIQRINGNTDYRLLQGVLTTGIIIKV